MSSRRLIQTERLSPSSIVVNMARGGIVNDQALMQALDSHHVAGAVLDVYEKEPLAADHPLRKASNVLLMPHMGASTFEAQKNVAVDVAEAVRDALLSGELSRSLNVATVSRDEWRELHQSMAAAQRAAAVARAVLASEGNREIRRVSLKLGPEIVNGSDVILASAALGVLEGVVESERLNLINARAIAELRGLELAVRESDTLGHPGALEVCLMAGNRDLAVEAVAVPGAPTRITRIGEFHVDVPPRRILIVLTNNDVPGVIGRVGTVLGEASINIASYHQSRVARGGKALAAISVDDPVPEEVRQRLLSLPEVLSATVVIFR